MKIDVHHLDNDLRMKTLEKMINEMKKVALERHDSFEVVNLWDSETTYSMRNLEI